jgi:outer membrane receptor protein involved in Fe transport
MAALGIALAIAMLAAPVLAQETTGNVAGFVTSDADGTALPGVTVTLTSAEGGVQRVQVTDTEGSYRFNLLPVGRYTLTAALEGYQTLKQEQVNVALGRTTQVAFSLPAGSVEEAITVTSEAPLIDVSTTVTGVNVSMDELADRVPISHDVTQVALLAPGTAPGDEAFNTALSAYTPGQRLTSIGGGSVAENNYIINGLNVSNFRNGVGGSNVPFEFVKEVQVKAGGYEAEFGRSTGGVLNMISRSGSNAFHGGVSVYYNPESLQEQSPDFYDGLNSLEEREGLEANASLGGPIWKDRVFFFGFYQYNDIDFSRVDIGKETLRHYDDPYYGGKLDINLTQSHRLEGTYFTDEVTVESDSFDHDEVTRQRGASRGPGTHDAGGENMIGRYTGIFGSHVVLSGQYGENDFNRTILSAGDAFSAAVDSRDGGLTYIGNSVNLQISKAFDNREATRLDLDGFFGNHSARVGADDELNTSDDLTSYSGGDYYRYFLNGVRYPQVSSSTEIVRYRIYDIGGTFETESNALYAQDSWEITPRWLLNFGLRAEQFDNKNALGDSYIKIDDQYAPRVGAVWDVSGDGRSKLYASAGRYHLYIASNTNIRLAGNEFFTEDWYTLKAGCVVDAPTKDTCLGTQLDALVFADGEVQDVRATRANDVDPMYQDEYRLGYERMMGENWSVGLSVAHRDLGDTIEDITLDEALGTRGANEYRLANPGTIFNGWVDADHDGTLEPISFDQLAVGFGFQEPVRKYYETVLHFNRRFTDNWMLQGSFTWAHGYGNYEGYVRSDNGQDDAGITTQWDFTGLIQGGDGNLPNDRRYNARVFGAYQFPINVWVGASVGYRDGRALNSFGVHTDPFAATYGNESFYRQLEFLPRGSFGRSDDITDVDLTAKYDLDLSEKVALTFRADVFNVFDFDTATELDEQGDEESGAVNEHFLDDLSFQQPRAVRFNVGLRF